MAKNGTCASPATAYANSVFPVPGGPTNSAPFGSLAPIFLYFSGSCKKSTISVNAYFILAGYVIKTLARCGRHIHFTVVAAKNHGILPTHAFFHRSHENLPKQHND